MKHMRRFTALVLALVMVFSLTVSASAATAQTVTVKLSPNITVKLDGEAQAMTDVKGNPVYPVLYGGTTYLPVRAVGNMLGLGVDWDQATQTVLLTTAASMEPATSGGKTPANAKPTDITVSINPNITVKLDGETQKMTNVNGDPVYPMLYGGTTYLPVRAVSNMLGVDVDWDQATQTVLLTTQTLVESLVLTDASGKEITVNLTDTETARKQLKALGWKDEFIERAVNGPRDGENINKLLMEVDGINPDQQTGQTDPFNGKQTTENAKVLGDKHIGYEWGEIDWSTASKGYVRVKINTELIGVANCDIWWHNENNDGYHDVQSNLALTEGWQNIPLWHSNEECECVVAINVVGVRNGYFLSWDDATLQAKFTAKINNSNSMWLMSNIKADYDRAPNVYTKAKELTKNCKTDAEKITAIYNFVSSTIVYDENLTPQSGSGSGAMYMRNLNPDNILTSKRGICEHYAVLMTAMLRSVGVPCKFVAGQIKSDGEWWGHDWVAVKPETGTLNISGAGMDHAGYDANGKPTDPTGWIRLDPTNAHTPNITSNDNNYRTSEYY